MTPAQAFWTPPSLMLPMLAVGIVDAVLAVEATCLEVPVEGGIDIVAVVFAIINRAVFGRARVM